MTAHDQMEQVAEKLVDVQKLEGSAFTHIGRCKRCGWQTMQNDEDSAKKLVKTHAMVHGPELVAELASVKSAQEPKVKMGR